MTDSSQTMTYLIMMRDVVIAQDIAMIISDHDADALVIITKDREQANEAVTHISGNICAFLADRPANFVNSALAQAIARQNGKVILLGHDAEVASPTPDWSVLDLPFTDRDVQKHLAPK